MGALHSSKGKQYVYMPFHLMMIFALFGVNNHQDCLHCAYEDVQVKLINFCCESVTSYHGDWSPWPARLEIGQLFHLNSFPLH